MKNLLIAAVVAWSFLCSHSCINIQRTEASKNYVTRVVKTDNFNAIRLTGSPNVVYTQTEGKVRVEVYGPDNIVDLLDVYTENGFLNVKFKKNTPVFNTGKLEVRVFAPSLDKMEITGSGNINIASGIKTDKNLYLSVTGSGDISGSGIRCARLSLSVTGSGDIELNRITAENTQARVTGSGDIDLSGTTQSADYVVSGSGDIDAVRLEADAVSANVSGSGDISCHAVSLLKAQRAGSGEISYKGNPEVDAPQKGVHRL
ncbi:hypothetical protein EZS27_012448 [termite gut metagenome]|uniref:Putative auto-transporter adhesin head GIN domain-containing protein n=1 Tax=termite gut metagenome TaxID=433724 RepID=A0A5J4S2G9_9ZZZZ